MFAEDTMTDVVDLGINQSDFTSTKVDVWKTHPIDVKCYISRAETFFIILTGPKFLQAIMKGELRS